ncbi:RNase adaptor protein RapZ [Lottiidibacillus patelloidae]|uniref:RNase adaptor protein RapZ n=1 Tax=Lottiidibacillus patelloidae TaxID=2670334 RepID=A0A263BQR4_9BACI|nr:RNase adapter RapZ [Lottiidibacillus patelloidae]OZM56040.1 RNase adaptor protein RapZ [Lottiidibacillus patelloidae]
METNDIQIVIITGMSGAGKTVAIQSFEDLGYFCIDNMPPSLLPKFVQLVGESGQSMNKVALVMDLRGREFFDSLFQVLSELSLNERMTPQIMFLDAKDEKLVSRYKETRRSHPLASTPLEGIRLERELMEDLKGKANRIIDTTSLKPIQLREKIIEYYKEIDDAPPFTVNVLSFGFKHGIPIDADLVFDVRFLPNPHYIEHLRPLTGLNEEVSSYVLRWQETQKFLDKLLDFLAFVLPQYQREGKSNVVIAIGCTGGKHRSVTLAEVIYKHFGNEYHTEIAHRDHEKGLKE